MKIKISLLAMAIGAACAGVSAQSATASYTDVAPYTDIGTTGVGGGAPSQWKGQLSRAEVLDSLRQARSEGTTPVGDAIDYPDLMKKAPLSARAEQPKRPQTQVLGGPRDDVSGDGYRFVGGEAGFIFVGKPEVQR
jgi:hypothetical protein